MAGNRRKKTSVLASAGALLLCAAAGVIAWLTGPQKPAAPVAGTTEGTTKIYFLDVGQGDSELIQLADGTNILIDAGTNDTAQELVSYIKDLGIEKLDFAIATHPHEDHIGGMAQIVKNFPIDDLIMPRIADSQTPTTRTYERLLDAIDEKNVKVTQAQAGAVVWNKNGVKLELLAPNSKKYEDLNNYSAVAKLTVGEKSFLFTGDAEKESEAEMVQQGVDLNCDVLKCGHHGSSTSTSAAFFKAVSPTAAIISCAKDNSYGHPHKETMQKLQKEQVAIYRTDEQGTILAQCDGKTIDFSTGLASVKK